jgi:hypothetical protein
MYCISLSTKSVKFWRENPANEHSISSEKFRIQKISSQFIADCSRVRKYPEHCTYLILLLVLSAYLLFMLWIVCDIFRFLFLKPRVLSRASLSFSKSEDKIYIFLSCTLASFSNCEFSDIFISRIFYITSSSLQNCIVEN